MDDITVSQMLDMQRRLQEKYKDKWGGLAPEKAVRQLLWLYGELGEVGDILKKQGSAAVMDDPAARAHFVEEMCDVLMYLGDVLLCFDIGAGYIAEAYTAKFEKNMNRW